MPSTINYDFPYPANTDPVNVPGDIGSLATALDVTMFLKAPLASPALTGTPTSTTAAVDTNTTQIATTAFVIGQSYAKLSSPTFTGTPLAPTAAVDTSTTQLATTAFVIGQGYLKSATASSTYSPIASPTFTGTVTSPVFLTTAADTATAASHYYVETASDGIIRPKTLANVKAEILASPTITGTLTAPLSTAGLVTTTSGGVIGSISYQRASADLMGYTSTPTAAMVTVLTNTSTLYQMFTGSTTQTITLPETSTLSTGWSFHIVNNSTGTLTVNSSGGNLVISIISGLSAMITCIGTALTTAADWEAGLTDFTSITGTGSVVLSTSPTLTTPTIGVASATSINKVLVTAPATSATLTLADGSTLATSGAFSTTLTATAETNVTLPTTGTLATLGSPTFTGVPAAPTATLGTNTTQLATTEFVQSAVAATVKLSGTAPASPVDGMLWYNTGTLALSIYYNAAWNLV